MNAPDTAPVPSGSSGPFGALSPSGVPGLDGGITLDALCLRFGQTEALQDVSASIPRGEITGLVGPDAAGKTTLMRVMAGLLRPGSGTVRIFGLPPEDAAAAGITGYMPQRFGLYEDLSVQANLALHARLRGVEGEGREELFARLLRFTGLARFTTRLAGKLSGGMKQKLGIACSLLGAPRALLLDEPGVGVDPLSRRELWKMVEELRDGGMTIVWSTAYLDEAERCPHVLMLDAGRVLHVGAPAALVRRVRGRVFRLTQPGGEQGAGARALLARWAATPGVDDALIQGSHVRVVLGETHELGGALRAAGAVVVPPRLEDAYMSALGGISHTPSPFAAAPATSLEPGPREAPVRIEARGLCKRFGDFVAAHDISFQVRAGEIFGLLGPNGAGKSTTFRMLCGLSRPSAGRCEVDGVDLLSAGSAARSRLGYMAQKFSLYPDIRVSQNIAIMADLYGLSHARKRERIAELAEALELTPWLGSVTGALPLGQKQRLALLCATLHNPPVLFLDEPTSGVDARTRRDFWKHITAMTRAGTAVLVTTHFMEEAEYCDAIALVYQGRVISAGTPDFLKANAPYAEGHGQGAPEEHTLEDAFIAHISHCDAGGAA